MKEVLKDIKPTKKEEQILKNKVNQILKQLKSLKLNPILGGSGAKNTWLKGNHDLDIFVKFKRGTKNISKILENKLKKKFKIEKLHGSRDYFRIKQNNFTFEIVPITNITKASQAENITDISPLHYKWVNKYKKYNDDIRLAKALTIAQRIYGAESYIKGFSGYVLEILTIHYKGFNNLMKNAAKWKKRTIIDTNKLLKNPLKELNKAKTQSPLIVVDPVDKTRNAASALSQENFSKFIKVSKSYLKKPSKKLFIEIPVKIPKKSVIIKFKTPEGKQDIVGAKLVKKQNFIVRKLNKEGFKVKKYGWDWDKYWFEVKHKTLSKTKEIQGPPLQLKIHVKKFKKSHKSAYTKKKRLYAKIKRKHPRIEDFIKYWIRYYTF